MSLSHVGCGLMSVLAALLVVDPAWGQNAPLIPEYAKQGRPSDLPLPSTLPLADYERGLYDFLFGRTYTRLGWAVDREVRDTGPFILGANYGTHPAVRIYYSPGVLEWLVHDREGDIPDGAMIIKEMFSPPAARYQELKKGIEAQYPDDPGKAEEVYQASLEAALVSWAVLVKDQSVSKEGWFWANPSPGTAPDAYDFPFNFPASGSGLGTCLRCHSSAEKEATFSSLNNIKGFEQVGDPLRFRVDDSWRSNVPAQQRPAIGESEAALILNFFQHLPEASRPQPPSPKESLSAPLPEFVSTFAPVVRGPDGKPVHLLKAAEDLVQAFPGQWADRVPAAPGGAEQFITSDNCLGCHGGLGGAPFGVTMFVQTGPNYGDGYNVSEFGEWRWSPMGLAGRDPIFYAQLESEFAILAQNAKEGLFPAGELREYQQAVANTCLSCHGAMGQRQLKIDSDQNAAGIDDPNYYYPDYILLTDPLTRADEERLKATQVEGLDGPHSVYPYRKYGNLAREGISCTVCHHIDPPTQWTDEMSPNQKLAAFLLNSTTGVFPYSPREELNGPFDDVRTLPMENSLGITPQLNSYVQDSKMCGTCHAINLPNVDAPTDRPLQGLDPADQRVLNQAARNGADSVPLGQILTKFQHSIEQATYLEWENSAFAWDSASFQSCQDCHMPGGLHTLDGNVDIDQLVTQIATIQDAGYPEAEGELAADEIDVPVRSDYRRHELVGLNVFLLEMFDQFDRLLGIDKSDPMTSAANGDQFTIDNMLRQARYRTVALDVNVTSVGGGSLEAEVRVSSMVGHRFPSGVGFRRAFLEFLVVRDNGGVEEVVWGSGRTNSVGVIVDGAGVPLKTEFLDQPDPDSKIPLYQKHHQVITSQDQVQIYEELVLNAQDQFTTSFIHRDDHPKDNRLVPFGFIDPVKDPAGFNERFGDSETIRAFMKATMPEGRARQDPDFGPGTDTVKYRVTLPQGLDPRTLTVKVTMYYQAIPPYWLHQRFSLAPDQPGTQRLYYLASHLNTVGTAIENWKLPLVSVTAKAQD